MLQWWVTRFYETIAQVGGNNWQKCEPVELSAACTRVSRRRRQPGSYIASTAAASSGSSTLSQRGRVIWNDRPRAIFELYETAQLRENKTKAKSNGVSRGDGWCDNLTEEVCLWLPLHFWKVYIHFVLFILQNYASNINLLRCYALQSLKCLLESCGATQ